MQTQFLNTRIDLEQGILPDEVSAAVFDCDGLLADTETLWLRVVADCAADNGIRLDNVASFRGVSIENAAGALAAPNAKADDKAAAETELIRRLTDQFAELISTEARPMPGAVEFIRSVASVVPVAVASNSPRALLDRILTQIGLADMIPTSVARDEVSECKPSPDLYMAAIEKLRTADPRMSAQTAVAFEDSAVGSRAAMSSGLLVIGINSEGAEQLSCHVHYPSLTDSRLADWAGSLRRWNDRRIPIATAAIGTFDPETKVLAVQCRYPDDQRARVEIHAQDQCIWNELPGTPPAAAAELPLGERVVHINTGHLPAGVYRYFLTTDTVLPEWNGRTGEFTVPSPGSGTPLGVPSRQEVELTGDVEVMAWNLWFGGCHVNNGLSKQVAYLREHPSQIVALQECFEVHGRRLAKELGWNIAQQGADTAVISPYPVQLHQTSTGQYATCATVHLGQKPVTVWSVHLWHSDYGPYTGVDPAIPAEFTLASFGERLRAAQLAQVLMEQGRLERDGLVSPSSPVLIAGDFNVPSHLDWKEGTHANAIAWPGSIMLELAGYIDTFRTVHPVVEAAPGGTWSPILPSRSEPRDRIDFVYSRGFQVRDATIVAGDPDASLGEHGVRRMAGKAGFMGRHLDNTWPTDHAAVVVRLGVAPEEGSP